MAEIQTLYVDGEDQDEHQTSYPVSWQRYHRDRVDGQREEGDIGSVTGNDLELEPRKEGAPGAALPITKGSRPNG